ncbi:hypothetical protein NPIL_711 [Nephila pilipes]|uniref:Uncharacterized protein n=1 Tax=Nephila pilipes TaxID=299642 RepID=A0A8X6I6T5_NEPPI|nr:hypothetical protein NPIL_711 [Nephila pilipes]
MEDADEHRSYREDPVIDYDKTERSIEYDKIELGIEYDKIELGIEYDKDENRNHRAKRRFWRPMSLVAGRWQQDLREWSIELKNNIDRAD